MKSNGGGIGNPVYRRVLLKLSGEAFGASGAESINADTLYLIASQIKEVAEAGVQMACVIGGGNIWRGRAAGSAIPGRIGGSKSSSSSSSRSVA